MKTKTAMILDQATLFGFMMLPALLSAADLRWLAPQREHWILVCLFTGLINGSILTIYSDKQASKDDWTRFYVAFSVIVPAAFILSLLQNDLRVYADMSALMYVRLLYIFVVFLGIAVLYIVLTERALNRAAVKRRKLKLKQKELRGRLA